MPKISVIIPVYNTKPEYFKEAVESVINQSVKPDEIIIVDDGSDKPIIDDFTSSTDIKIIRNEKNKGIGYCRQFGVEEATGDYIAQLSSDDIWDEKYLETMIKIAKQQPNKILYSKYYIINENSEMVGDANVQGYGSHEDFCIACFEDAYRNNMFVNFSTTFFPKEVFKKVKFDKNLIFGEDLDFLLKSMKHFEYYFVPKYLLKYRVGDTTTTSKIRFKIAQNNEMTIKSVKEYWEEN